MNLYSIIMYVQYLYQQHVNRFTCIRTTMYALYGKTALHVASGAGQSAVVTSLLDHGADVHAGTEVGDCSTALVCTLVLWLTSFLSILTLLG